MNIDATPETVRATTEALELAALLDDRVGHSDDARIIAWAERVERFRLEREDLLDGVQAFYETNRPQPMSIGDLLDAARAVRRDRQSRESVTERLEHADTVSARKAADDTRGIAAAFAAAAGPAPNRTPRLIAAVNALQCCYGAVESKAAIREFLAAKTEARRVGGKTPQPLTVDPAAVVLAQTVRCRWCHAQPGQPCVATDDRPPAGGFHATRLEDAQVRDARKVSAR